MQDQTGLRGVKILRDNFDSTQPSWSCIFVETSVHLSKQSRWVMLGKLTSDLSCLGFRETVYLILRKKKKCTELSFHGKVMF